MLSRFLDYESPYYRVSRVLADFGGFRKEYFVLEHGERAGVVVAHANDILLIRQYRFLLDDLSWEIPGGRVEPGEAPDVAAARECREEAGIICQDLQPLLVYQLGVEINHNPTHLFHTSTFDADEAYVADTKEVQERHWVPRERVLGMIRDGTIVDSFSLLGLFSYFAFTGKAGRA